MQLRSYQPGDATQMYALDEICFASPFRFSQAAMRRFAEAKNAIVRLAFDDGPSGGSAGLLGFCIVHLEHAKASTLGYVVTLDVAPAWRRQGIASALLYEVEAAAAEAGARGMGLHVHSENESAIRLYEWHGYVHAHVAPDFYGRGLDAQVYRKLLAE